jgi:hypothetical protein
MYEPLIRPSRAVPGDRIAVLSPSFAAPAVAPQVHEQAMRRLEELTGLEPVEYPTTRRLGASSQDRAADVSAFRDPEIRAVLATIGGEDQITVVPHLDPDLVPADPKPLLGYSDNTNLLNWLGTTASPASTAARNMALLLLAQLLLVTFGLSQIELGIPLLLRTHLDISPTTIGVLFALGTLVILTGQLPVSRVVERVHRTRALGCLAASWVLARVLGAVATASAGPTRIALLGAMLVGVHGSVGVSTARRSRAWSDSWHRIARWPERAARPSPSSTSAACSGHHLRC